VTEALLDRDVRLLVYEHFLAEASPPTSDEVATALSLTPADVEASFRRLEEGRVLVFAPGTRNIWMAHPLSAFPTPFRVETARGAYWGACVWDGFGTVAMVGGGGTVRTSCACCGEEMTLELEEGVLEPAEGVAHFAVPARHWWDNIGYT
jgi:alkylmercury lyase-like protein